MDANSTYLPPLKAITDTDHGGILAIATAMGFVFAILSLLIRAFVRRECGASFAKDDLAATLSMASATIQSSVVFVAIARGFGKSSVDLTAKATQEWERDIYIGDVFYLVTLWLTKCSVALLLMRLSRDPKHGLMARLMLAATMLVFVVSLLTTTIRCDLSQPWDFHGTKSCPSSTFARWTAITVMNVVLEIALFVGGLWLVRDLQLSMRKKSIVVIAYGLRLPVIVAAIMRLRYLSVQVYSDDPSFHGIIAAVCTQVEMCYAVVATTTPCLRPFMSALNTQYGGGPGCIITTHLSTVATMQRSHHGQSMVTASQMSGTSSRRSTESSSRFFDGRKSIIDDDLDDNSDNAIEDKRDQYLKPQPYPPLPRNAKSLAQNRVPRYNKAVKTTTITTIITTAVPTKVKRPQDDAESVQDPLEKQESSSAGDNGSESSVSPEGKNYTEDIGKAV